jgi:hypothetical protein
VKSFPSGRNGDGPLKMPFGIITAITNITVDLTMIIRLSARFLFDRKSLLFQGSGEIKPGDRDQGCDNGQVDKRARRRWRHTGRTLGLGLGRRRCNRQVRVRVNLPTQGVPKATHRAGSDRQRSTDRSRSRADNTHRFGGIRAGCGDYHLVAETDDRGGAGSNI